ncbi:ComEC/Rec2 family competence protein [Sphingomonas soli]|uniref:ComEC/Rec2 family competence protein n=1 Tax=Sphingomonas soli TaxID=266127 RepID=UPI00082CACD3|nr:MBL fold metallo-hydrolase [Sphingomonas soli]
MPYLDDDIVDLRRDDGTTRQYYWGDEVEIVAQDAQGVRIRIIGLNGPLDEGRVRKDAKFRDDALLRLSMVDVQQGDGMILETPGGKRIFIDGGDNKLFARHVAARFRGTTAVKPLLVDLMLVTHGDADHFEGLNELRKSETDTRASKRVFVAPKRYYHNGIVKRPGKKPGGSTRPELEMLGPTTKVGGVPLVTGLVDDPAALPPGERNGPFTKWTETLAAWEPRVQLLTGSPIERRRIDHRSGDAFDFLAEDGVTIEMLGPIAEETPAGPGLRFLKDPPDDASLMLGTIQASGGSWSASHTINGHSIAFRLRYGNVRFLLTGDMNQEAGQRLREALPGASLRAEILKAPHHGSADFDMEMLKEVGPVVSMISSGDESKAKEYIHPRATLMAALGKASRGTPAVIFITELAAFFAYRGEATDAGGKKFVAFERTNFGIVHIRTDGMRVLALTHSGKEGMNEAYRFMVSPNGEVVFAPAVVKRSAPPKST